MSSLNNKSDMPKEGKNLIVVAVVQKICISAYLVVKASEEVDADEKKLTARPKRVAELRNRLKGLWPPHELTDKRRAR